MCIGKLVCGLGVVKGDHLSTVRKLAIQALLDSYNPDAIIFLIIERRIVNPLSLEWVRN